MVCRDLKRTFFTSPIVEVFQNPEELIPFATRMVISCSKEC